VVVHYLIALLPGLFVILLEQIVYQDTFELGETVHRDFALPRLAVFAASEMHTRRNNQRRSASNVRSQRTHARAQEATHLCDDCIREFRPISGSLYGTDINS
jgi:hypothetical protein